MAKRNWVCISLLTLLLGGLIFLVVQTSNNTVWGGGYWEQWLVGQAGLTMDTAHQVVFYFRKTVHFLFYGLLALLFQIYFRLWGLRRFTKLMGIFTGTGIAMFDEYYQSLASFRSGKIEDVLLDFCGAVVITTVVAWAGRKRRTSWI